jgi:hypothetical protein
MAISARHLRCFIAATCPLGERQVPKSRPGIPRSTAPRTVAPGLTVPPTWTPGLMAPPIWADTAVGIMRIAATAGKDCGEIGAKIFRPQRCPGGERRLDEIGKIDTDENSAGATQLVQRCVHDFRHVCIEGFPNNKRAGAPSGRRAKSAGASSACCVTAT